MKWIWDWFQLSCTITVLAFGSALFFISTASPNSGLGPLIYLSYAMAGWFIYPIIAAIITGARYVRYLGNQRHSL